MKLKALKKFWMKDTKKGCMVCRDKDEEFEMDHAEEGESVYNLLHGLCVTVIDEKFVPKTGQYFCLHSFGYKNEDGFPRHASSGREISLPQDLACQFMVNGHARPMDENAWTPRKLLSPTVKEGQVKKMFDDLPVEKGWVRKGMRDGDR